MLMAALNQTWPPFVLVVGLLLVGEAAADDGLFESLGAQLGRAPLSPHLLLVGLLALVAVVTAVLNLDTSVVFMTPVLVHAARRRGVDERPFLYGAVFMSNAGSLLLPGSNLTNLLVQGGDHVGGFAFARDMLPAWLVACALTAAFVALVYRLPAGEPAVGGPPLRLGLGAAATAAVAVLVLALPQPALPVLVVGLGVTAARRARPRVGAPVLGILFGLTVALGVASRAYDGPARLLGHTGRWSTAAVAALAANLVNNLPAAVLFSAQPPPHPRALLLGLNLGPDLAVTGSLAAYLWFRAARAAGARPSIVTYSRLGLVLAPLTLVATLPRIA